MENNKRGHGGRKKDDNNPEKRSSRPPRSSSKTGASRTARTEKPFKKEKPSESSRDDSQGYRKDKPSEYTRSRSSGPGRPWSERNEDKPSGYKRDSRSDSGDYKPSGYGKERSSGPGRPRSTDRSDDKPSGYRREPRADSGDYKPSGYDKERSSGPGRPRSTDRSDDKPSRYGKESPAGSDRGRSSDRSEDRPSGYRKPRASHDTGKPPARKARPVKADENAPLRLNKFIANAGVCSRREADKLIETGAVKVNGVIVTELGTKVSPADRVQLGDQTLSSERLRYVLLNKPKGYITTSDDPFKRNTVMNLIAEACKERIYPVGRLDRNTTGLLLFTNDGELTKRLTHPRFGVRKIYDVELDKTLSKKDMESIAAGVEFDGETIIVDEIAYVEYEKNKKHVGIELHSGQNRVVRRIFEQFGYEVVKLDRVMIGSLTKKDLQRGFWRHLTDIEVRMLKRL